MNFKDISFKQKIYSMLALPMLGFVWLSISSIAQSVTTSKEMSTLGHLTHLSVVYSNLVHELQKERGMTAGYLGSKGARFVDELRQQRVESSNKIAVKDRYESENEFKQAKIQQLKVSISDGLDQLGSIRRQVDLQTIKLTHALAFYSQLNAKLLSVSALIAAISTEPELKQQFVAYYNFLQGKERAGIERAVLSNTFAKDSFGKGMLAKFTSLVTAQNTYFSNFNAFANQNNKAFYEQQLNNSFVDEVVRMRQVAMSKTQGFSIDAVYWFKQSSGRIVQLKSIEDKLGATIIELANIKYDASFTTMLVNILLSALLIIMASGISIYVIKELNARVKDLTSVMSQVRDNNDLTARTKHAGKSELGQISLALNLTLQKFSGAIDSISSSSIALATTAEQTSQTCEYNSTTMAEQQSGISVIATAVEELSMTVKEVANNTQLSADSAKEADVQAQNGLVIVQRSYHSIESLANEINNLAIQISALHESSLNITKVVDVIKSVADQTNLLALNAAIEAARAGDQGRGFAVVADEVRTLAQRTQDSTSEIETFITSLQTNASAAFKVIETSQHQAKEAVENSKEVETTLQDITSSISNITAMTEQIAAAVEQQSVVSQDVAENIMTIEEKASESTTGAEQITVTAREQAQLASSLQSLASTFKI